MVGYKCFVLATSRIIPRGSAGSKLSPGVWFTMCVVERKLDRPRNSTFVTGCSPLLPVLPVGCTIHRSAAFRYCRTEGGSGVTLDARLIILR